MSDDAIRGRMKIHLAAAKELAKRAREEQRDFTKEEREQAERHLAKIELLQEDLAKADPQYRRERAAQDAKEFWAAVDQQYPGLMSADMTTGGLSHNPAGGRKAGGAWSTAFLKGLPYQPATGRKDLLPVSGSVTVGQLSSTIGALSDDERAQTVLQVIGVEQANGDQYSYLRESVRSHQAAPVAIGEKKPQSTYTLERIDDRIRTLAHLSEPISRNWLSDAPMLASYIDNALRSGVILELEYQIFQGTGAGEDLPGILNAANVLGQLFFSDILTTTRKAITQLEERPVNPTAWVFHPTDWETVELLTASGSGEFLVEGSPIDRARRRLWGLPVALTVGIPAGTALVADWRSAVTLLEREPVRVDWSEAFAMPATVYEEAPGTGFQHNMVQFRGEGRWGLMINRPAAIVEVDVAGGS